MFSVDGVRWPWACAIERAAALTASEVSGTLLDGSYLADVLGTFMSYTVSLAVPIEQRDRYSELYEILTSPVEGHAFALPYNQGVVELTGRVEKVSDVYARLAGGRLYWKGARFTIVANHPTKALSLDEVMSRGRTMLPELSTPAEGDTYTYTQGAWARAASYRDADGIAY